MSRLDTMTDDQMAAIRRRLARAASATNLKAMRKQLVGALAILDGTDPKEKTEYVAQPQRT